jgi:hypothetical protein
MWPSSSRTELRVVIRVDHTGTDFRVDGSSSFKPTEPAGAVAEAVDLDSHVVAHRNIMVSQGGLSRVVDVPPRRDGPVGPSCQEDRQVIVRVSVPIANAAAIDNQRELPGR